MDAKEYVDSSIFETEQKRNGKSENIQTNMKDIIKGATNKLAASNFDEKIGTGNLDSLIEAPQTKIPNENPTKTMKL